MALIIVSDLTKHPFEAKVWIEHVRESDHLLMVRLAVVEIAGDCVNPFRCHACAKLDIGSYLIAKKPNSYITGIGIICPSPVFGIAIMMLNKEAPCRLSDEILSLIIGPLPTSELSYVMTVSWGRVIILQHQIMTKLDPPKRFPGSNLIYIFPDEFFGGPVSFFPLFPFLS